MSVTLKRGEVWLADLNPTQGSEQAGVRPVIVFQNDVVSQFSSTTITTSQRLLIWMTRSPIIKKSKSPQRLTAIAAEQKHLKIELRLRSPKETPQNSHLSIGEKPAQARSPSMKKLIQGGY